MLCIASFCLVQYVPYNVSVRAATSAGLGRAAYDVQFTQQGGTLVLRSVDASNNGYQQH